MKQHKFVGFLMFVLLSATTIQAQFAQRGGVEGTVYDSTGAVIPGALVTLRDLAQNQGRQITADNQGHFEFDNLTAGQYQLTASFHGFRTESAQSIAVGIGAILHYDFKLHASSVEESVTVNAEAVGLETDQTGVDTNITARQFEDLPLNGRNFTAVAALAPGVATYPQNNINTTGTYSAGAMYAVGGTQFTTGGAFEGSRDNGFYVNGVNINDNYMSSNSYEPSTEAMETGTIRVADFSAASGHDISTLTMQTKGGSSTLHAEAYEFMENTDLNAINPWTKAQGIITGTPPFKPILQRNQFGGNVGGPVYIPGVPGFKSLRNRVFFFANYENFIEHDGNKPFYSSVPSAAERTGDFSELLTSNVQLYNPFFTTYDSAGNSTRPAIAGNRLDLALRPDGTPLIDAKSADVLKLWPEPNIANTPSNELNRQDFLRPGISEYHIDTRFDAHITSSDSVFITWSHAHGASSNSGGIPPLSLFYFAENAPYVVDDSYLVTANYLHSFSPRMTNELIVGFGKGTTGLDGDLPYLNSSANPLNQLFQNTGSGLTRGLLKINVGNYVSPGDGESFKAGNQAIQFSDNFDWVHGRHTITAGVNYIAKSEHDWDIQRDITFGGFSTSGSASGYAGGDAMADLMMGIVNNWYQRFNIDGGDPTSPDWNIRFPSWGMYVNDRYRWSPKFTISLGLRYDLSIPDYTPDTKNSPCCAIYVANAQGGELRYPGIAPGLAQHYLSASKIGFAPRVGISYEVNPKTAIRAGYGIFYDLGATQISTGLSFAVYGGATSAVNYTISNTTSNQPVDTPYLTLEGSFPAPLSTTLGSFPVPTGTGAGYAGDDYWSTVTYLDQKSVPLPYYQRLMLDVQRQVGTHDVVTLSYSGVQGRKGTNEVNQNLATYQTGWINGGGSGDPTYNAARPNHVGRFGDIYVIRPNLNSFYNAAIVQYRHDFDKGFQITSSYTLGKTVSDYPLANSVYGGGAAYGISGTGFQYPNVYDRGESSQSHRHRVVFSGVWSPEYGKGWHHWARIPLTGWRMTGIWTLESGDALTVSDGYGTTCAPSDSAIINCPTGAGTSARDDAGFQELIVSGSPNLSHGQKSFARQFDVSKFAMPAMDVRGNSGLGTVRGPGQNNVDFSLAKTFNLYDRLHLEFRGDAFNALNHTQWTGVNTTFPTGNPQAPFGQVNAAREARIGQLGAKLIF